MTQLTPPPNSNSGWRRYQWLIFFVLVGGLTFLLLSPSSLSSNSNTSRSSSSSENSNNQISPQQQQENNNENENKDLDDEIEALSQSRITNPEHFQAGKILTINLYRNRNNNNNKKNQEQQQKQSDEIGTSRLSSEKKGKELWQQVISRTRKNVQKQKIEEPSPSPPTSEEPTTTKIITKQVEESSSSSSSTTTVAAAADISPTTSTTADDDDDVTTTSAITTIIIDPSSSASSPQQQQQQKETEATTQEKVVDVDDNNKKSTNENNNIKNIFKVNPHKDQLPELHEKMLEAIKNTHEKISQLSPLQVIPEAVFEEGPAIDSECYIHSDTTIQENFDDNEKTSDENNNNNVVVRIRPEGSYETFYKPRIVRFALSRNNNNNNNRAKTSAITTTRIRGGIPNKHPKKTESLFARKKFIRHVSEMFEMMPGISTTMYTYARPWLRWELNKPNAEPTSENLQQKFPSDWKIPFPRTTKKEKEEEKSSNFPPARMACLFAGFMRDFEFMHRSCEKSSKKCRSKKRRRGYGYQNERLLGPLDCDVFVSTWHIRGAGRYFTTTYNYDEVLNDPHYLIQKYQHRLAAIHVHNYSEYGKVWHAAHRFRRNFPQVVAARETSEQTWKRRLSRGKTMFAHRNEEHDFIRLNDYSQSFKHYCAVLLTWQYESWARGSYDVYFRLRTDERAVRIFHQPFLVWKKPKLVEHDKTKKRPTSVQTEETPPPAARTVEGDDVPTKDYIRYVAFELCPGPKFGKETRKPISGASPAQLKQIEKESNNNNQQQQDDENDKNNNNDDGGGKSSSSPVQVEEAGQTSCDRHILTASSTLGHERKFDDLFKIFQGGQFSENYFVKNNNNNKKDSEAEKEKREKVLIQRQRFAVNSFDIGDLGYMGSPELITHLGTSIWNLCSNKSSNSTTPAFSTNSIVSEHLGAHQFSEYNLMLWRKIFDSEPAWELESFFYALRISRSLMQTVNTKIKNAK